MASKDIYESHMYRAAIYAAGMWRGVGQDVVQDLTITRYPVLRGSSGATKILKALTPARTELKGRQ